MFVIRRSKRYTTSSWLEYYCAMGLAFISDACLESVRRHLPSQRLASSTKGAFSYYVRLPWERPNFRNSFPENRWKVCYHVLPASPVLGHSSLSNQKCSNSIRPSIKADAQMDSGQDYSHRRSRQYRTFGPQAATPVHQIYSPSTKCSTFPVIRMPRAQYCPIM